MLVVVKKSYTTKLDDEVASIKLFVGELLGLFYKYFSINNNIIGEGEVSAKPPIPTAVKRKAASLGD